MGSVEGIKYFAYGSNMFFARLRDRVPSAQFPVVVSLKKHVINFNKISNDGSGKCSIHQTDGIVYGVVFNIPNDEKANLDMVEGLGYGYSEKTIKVVSLSDEQEIEAITYQALRVDNSLKPYDWYKAYVVSGAKEHGLPESYVAMLENIVAIKDPDEGRAEKEWKFLKQNSNTGTDPKADAGSDF